MTTQKQLEIVDARLTRGGEFTWGCVQSFSVRESKNKDGVVLYYLQLSGRVDEVQFCVLSDETTAREPVEELQKLALAKRTEYRKQHAGVTNDNN